jgi:uncharacterized membrane protein
MDTEPPRLRGFDKGRFETLVDGIFAVALTLLVLDIKLPENIAYPTSDALWLSINGMSYLSLDYLSRHMYPASPELNPTVIRLIKTRIGVLSLVPLASMLVPFYSTHASIYVYLPLALSHCFRGSIDEHIHTTAAVIDGLNEK